VAHAICIGPEEHMPWDCAMVGTEYGDQALGVVGTSSLDHSLRISARTEEGSAQSDTYDLSAATRRHCGLRQGGVR
jgi:hypothetical protein